MFFNCSEGVRCSFLIAVKGFIVPFYCSEGVYCSFYSSEGV